MKSHTNVQFANALKAADPSFPKVKYSPGKMPETVTSAAEEAALGPNWFNTNVPE